MPPEDDRPPRTTRRRSAEQGTVVDPPSGRWHPHEFDDGPTPPPHDLDAFERRRRLTTLEAAVARGEERTSGALMALDGRIAKVEGALVLREKKGDELAAAVNGLHRDSAVIATKLDVVQATLVRIEVQKTTGGATARNIVQLVLMLLALLASLTVGIISIVH